MGISRFSIIFLLSFGVWGQSYALETDNYLSWELELKDSAQHINVLFKDTISAELEEINGTHENLSCPEITQRIARHFKSHLVHDNPVENWLMSKLSQQSGEIYPQDRNYVEISIYRNPYLIYIPYFGLAPNIQVGGFYFGTDKLSHFASTGMIYFQRYQNALNDGRSESKALTHAIDWGLADENTVHGYWASGIFSFADLEANYQGLLFYKRLCSDGKNSYLAQDTNGYWGWSIARRFDIADYINGNWDETYLLSHFKPGNWKKIAPVLKAEYCLKANSPKVQGRMVYYQTKSAPSDSMKYIQSLQNSADGRLPPITTQTSFTTLCR